MTRDRGGVLRWALRRAARRARWRLLDRVAGLVLKVFLVGLVLLVALAGLATALLVGLAADLLLRAP
jgi:hypothetical protein